MKTCVKCSSDKQLSDFYKKASAKDGHSSYCKACHKAHDQSFKGKSVRKSYYVSKKNNICWQKKIRDKVLQEDVAAGFPTNVKASEFTLAQEKLTNEHRQFIKRYEWLGSIGFGVRYCFTARHNGLLGGVVLIAEPNGYQFEIHLEALIQRGACASWTPKNLGSRLVMFSCRWMVTNTSKRIFVAYSDPAAGEIGTIYQACNFDFLGQSFGSTIQYKLSSGKLAGNRHFTRTSAMKKWTRELGLVWQDTWCKPNGFQDVKAIPKDVMKQLKAHAKSKMSQLKKVKALKKGKYAILLQKKSERLIKPWVSLPYPKRKPL